MEVAPSDGGSALRSLVDSLEVRSSMVGFKCASGACRPLFTLLLLSAASSCGVQGPGEGPAGVATQESRAQSLLVSLAGLNPRVAEPLVKGFSAAALERAVVLVVDTGVEEATWAEGLLTHRWWVLEDPSRRLLGADGVDRVMSEVRRRNPDGGSESENRQREIRQELGITLSPGLRGEEDEGSGRSVQKEPVAAERGDEPEPAATRRAEVGAVHAGVVFLLRGGRGPGVRNLCFAGGIPLGFGPGGDNVPGEARFPGSPSPSDGGGPGELRTGPQDSYPKTEFRITRIPARTRAMATPTPNTWIP
jgi:hypothetical protein